MLQRDHALTSFVLWVVISFVGKNLREWFQQNIHQLSRCVFNMLIHQNERTGVFGIILWSASLLYFYLGPAWL